PSGVPGTGRVCRPGPGDTRRRGGNGGRGEAPRAGRVDTPGTGTEKPLLVAVPPAGSGGWPGRPEGQAPRRRGAAKSEGGSGRASAEPRRGLRRPRPGRGPCAGGPGMTTVAIHQPQYLPWAPLLAKAAACDVWVHLDSVPFQKNGVQNRNRIKTPQGPCWLTV